MHTKTLVLAFAAASAIMVEGAIVSFYSSPNCAGSTFSRNIYDNTCALNLQEGYQSFKITYPGGNGQILTTYSKNDCAGTHYACESAKNVGTCYNSFGNDNSGSNAISSGTSCGVA